MLGTKGEGYYRDIPKLISSVFTYVIQRGVQPAGPPIYVCHELSPEQLKMAETEGTAKLEVAIPISGDIEETDDFKVYELPGGKMAKVVHVGPYKDVGDTYKELFAWIVQNRKNIVGLMREYYVSDPNETPPEEIITEIYTPIE